MQKDGKKCRVMAIVAAINLVVLIITLTKYVAPISMLPFIVTAGAWAFYSDAKVARWIGIAIVLISFGWVWFLANNTTLDINQNAFLLDADMVKYAGKAIPYHAFSIPIPFVVFVLYAGEIFITYKEISPSENTYEDTNMGNSRITTQNKKGSMKK